jgi:hypothetical protein
MKSNPIEKYILLSVLATLLVLGWSGQALGLDIAPMKWTMKSDWIKVTNCTALTGVPSAKGNGTTDDTAAIQAAINYLVSHSDHGPYSTLYFPGGVYKITKTLTIPHCAGLNFVGCGINTMISWAGPSGAAMIHPDGTDSMRYIGFVWKGNNKAGCAYAHDSASGYYETDIRHENESFHDFTVPGTYVPGYTVPAGAITSGFYDGNEGLTGETMIYSCAFFNCSTAIYEGYQTYNNFMWHVDSCEFENCGNGVWFYNAGDMTISNSHFQNSSNVDVEGGRNLHVKHCTSTGSNIFYLTGGGAFANSIQDCYVDSWKNPAGAVFFGRYEQETIFDCTFTNPPAGSQGPINIAQEQISVLMSNNYCPEFPNGIGLLNYTLPARQVDVIPPGTRNGVLTSASKTFLNQVYANETTNVIDVTAAPYNADHTGVADATAAIQSAINAAIAANNGSEVYIPAGKYHLTSTLNASGSNYTLSGAGIFSQIQWWSTGNNTQLAISNPKKVKVKNLQFAVLNNIPGGPNYVAAWPTCDPSTMTSISTTATAACNIIFDDTYNTAFYVGNPPAAGFNPHGNGILLSNLPAGSTVYLNHVTNSVTVQNCGAAQIFARFLQMGVITVSGTGPKTGFFGALVAEGGQGDVTNGYNIVVNDNQDLAFSGYYSEQARNDLQMRRGGGTGTGRVTIDGFLSASGANGQQNPPSSLSVDVENYAGRLLYNGQAFGNGGGPVQILQNGTNPVDMDFPSENFFGGNTAPVFNVGTGANLIETNNEYNGANYVLNYMADVPNPLTAASNLSIAQGLDHLRQLEAVDLSVQFGITTDAPPVAVYPLEGTVADATGSGSDGTNHGATFAGGAVGMYAAQFNGASSYIQIPKTVTKSFSIAMWIQTTDTGAAGSWRLGRGLVDGSSSAKKSDYGTALNAGKFSLGIGGPDTTLTSTTAVNDGAWHHVAGIFNAATGAMQVYVDGVLNNSVTGAAVNHSAIIPLRIGSIQTGVAGGFFNGLIDQVQIYNYAISAADVAYLYERNVPLPPIVNGLVARWKLDEASGGTSADSTGHFITGTWQNSPIPSASVPPNLLYADPECLTFNGVNQYVSMTNLGALPSGTAARTICGWAKPNSVSGGYSWIAAFGSPGTSQAMFIGMNGNTLVGGGYGDDLNVGNFWGTSTWHFIALTYDGATANLYADGNLVASSPKTWNLAPSHCYIGEQVNNASEYFNGSIDDIRIYNRALSASEIANLAAGNP